MDASDRHAGILVPVFSLRRPDDLGIGDVEALKGFVDWAAELGFDFIQLLPVNETGSDHSPYNAISSVALDPLTLDCAPGVLTDLDQASFDAAVKEIDLAALRKGDVRYDVVGDLKLDLLWRAWRRFLATEYRRDTARDRAFEAFVREEDPWLGDYCLFRLLMDREQGNQNWQTWDESYREIEDARRFLSDLFRDEPEDTERHFLFYAYIQWVAHLQWAEVKQHASSQGVKLMGDMPFGVSFCSADVYGNREIFDLEWFGGAPPETNFRDDLFTMKWGQNWGIPLYRWDILEKDNYTWWRQRVEKLCESFSMFRIDHALGFYRIYSFPWNPVRNEEFLPLEPHEAAARCEGRAPGFRPRPDDTGEQCHANRTEGERYLKVLQEAAGDAEIIAEDLGFVPDYVVPSLTELGIPGMKIPHWEFDEAAGRFRRGDEFPELSYATYATHDHSPMRVQWEQHRRVYRGEDPEAGDAERAEARSFLTALSAFAGIEWDEGAGPEAIPAYDDSLRERLLAALFRSRSRYIGVMITDLLGLEDRINVPGVAADQNWTYRLEWTVEDLRRNPHWQYLNERIKKLLIESERASTVLASEA